MQLNPTPPHESMLNVLGHLLSERDAWDETPEWGLLYYRWHDDESSVAVRPFPIPEVAWAMAGDATVLFTDTLTALRGEPGRLEKALMTGEVRPKPGAMDDALQTLGMIKEAAALMTTALASMVEPNLCALYARVECWIPPEGYTRPASGRRVPYMNLPGAREARTGIAVDTSGGTCVVQQVRGEEELSGVPYGRGNPEMPAGEALTPVAETLAQVLAALLARAGAVAPPVGSSPAR